MYVILSQKVDTESSYEDVLFHSYHYPAKYRNQLHKGDIFIYYQGNRYDRKQRYYFGVGIVGEINSADGENFYAKLVNCQRFSKKVPIYLPDGGYIEQLGYDEVRKRINPPWQCSVRPISQQAYQFILNAANMKYNPQPESVAELKEKLKAAVREFYVNENESSILHIERIAASIAQSTNISPEKTRSRNDAHAISLPPDSPSQMVAQLLDYCQNMKMSYSYKPILILALLFVGDSDGQIATNTAVKYFRNYYEKRSNQGLCVEKRTCIYQNADVSDKQIIANLIANPIRVLTDSGFFFYNADTQIFSMSPLIWSAMDNVCKSKIADICREKLKMYYLD